MELAHCSGISSGPSNEGWSSMIFTLIELLKISKSRGVPPGLAGFSARIGNRKRTCTVEAAFGGLANRIRSNQSVHRTTEPGPKASLRHSQGLTVTGLLPITCLPLTKSFARIPRGLLSGVAHSYRFFPLLILRGIREPDDLSPHDPVYWYSSQYQIPPAGIV